MNIQTIKARLTTSLDISKLLPMQEEMAAIKLPASVLLCAPTGSGKTVAFSIALLRTLNTPGQGVKAVVMAPTRELALQIFDVLRPLAAPQYKTTALYGGHSFEAESRSLEGNPDIVIGTPGRILDHIRRGRLSLHSVATLVIDEYDKSLELGFREEMRAIVGRMKNVATLVLTSATVGEIPDFIGSVGHVSDYSSNLAAVPDIDLFEVHSAAADKLDTLVALLRSLPSGRCIVFVNHRDAAERVYENLLRQGFPAGIYHGGLEQQLRQRALILFNNGTTPILVSTDIASRGLDIEGVGAVIHYHLPPTAEAWTHRNGRTARMGASGRAFAIVSDHDKLPDYLPALEPFYPADEAAGAQASPVATLYINAGKKEKISKGDVAGYLINKGGLEASEVGRIDVLDHCAYVAVPAAKARAVALALAPHKLKNTRVRVTQLKSGR